MDTIGNMLTSIINGQRVGKTRVVVPYSQYKESLAQFLHAKGLLGNVRKQSGTLDKLVITLAYKENSQPKITHMKRLSKPGSRKYVKRHQIPYSFIGPGTVILSTPQGLMDDAKARELGLGGELVCEIW
jgi:small subunit ribosomal protein S8